MIIQRLILCFWVLGSGLVIAFGTWVVDRRFSPNPAIVELWLSYSYTIFFAAAGNLWASRAWPPARTSVNALWCAILLLSLLAYGFVALRTLMPAITHDIPFADLAGDTIKQLKFLQAAVVVLIGKLCTQIRRVGPSSTKINRHSN